jgi:hypothetical protein
MGDRWQWARRTVAIVAAGILFAIVVVEIQIALGFNLDSPFFHLPWAAIGFAVAALAFAAYQARPTAMRAGIGAGIAVFGLAVLPFNALLEPTPSIVVDFWRGGATLRIQRTMTVERAYPVVLAVSGPKDIDVTTPAQTTGGSGPVEGRPESLVAHLSGEPRSAFAIVPDKDEAKALNGKGDLRWTWDATPKQEGPQRLFLELDTTVKTPAGTTAKGNVYRQFILITVQAPTWYEAARKWLIGVVSGS